MDKLNNYFDKAKELKLDKELIDIQNFDSIIKKKSIKKNLIKGTVTMSILTIFILGITLLLPNEKENLKDFNPETMRRLPIFHLTIEEFENMNIVNIPKTYEELKLRMEESNTEYFEYKKKSKYNTIPFEAIIAYKNGTNKGFIQTGVRGYNSKKLNQKKQMYFQKDNQKIYKLFPDFKFVKNEFFTFLKEDFESFVNIVPLTLKDETDYIRDLVIFAIPNEDLYHCLPDRYKELYEDNFVMSDDIILDEDIIDEHIEKLRKKKQAKVEIKIPYLELSDNELKNIGLDINNEEIHFTIRDYNTKAAEYFYFKYVIDKEGKQNKGIKTTKPKLSIFSETYYIFRYKIDNGKKEELSTTTVHIQNPKTILNYNTFELVENSEDLSVNYNKSNQKEVDNILNRLIPVKFKIESKDKKLVNEYIFWFEITDEFISKLPARYQKRFNKEIELYQQVLDNTKELKELCAELEEESLLGLCINESINNINLYPNPAKSNIKIELDLDSKKEVLIKLFDVSGKEILSQGKSLSKGKNTIEYDVSKISSGIYIVNIFDGDVVMFSRNIIIE